MNKLIAIAVLAAAVAVGLVGYLTIDNFVSEPTSLTQEERTLIEKGVYHLKRTTVSYPYWLKRNYSPGARETTEWGKAFEAFATVTSPPPTTTAVTTTQPAPSSSTVQPGQSWDAAYDAASPGTVITVAAGEHGNHTITGVKPSPGVTFRGVAGSNARIISTSYAGGVTIENLSQVKVINAFDSDGVTFRGNNVGNCLSDATINCTSKVSSSRNVLIEGNNFRNVLSSDTVLYHIECLFVANGSDGVRIERNTFRRCQVYDIFFQTYDGSGQSKNITIQNNWLDAPLVDTVARRSTAISFSSPQLGAFQNTLIAYNSFSPDAGIELSGTGTGMTFTANLLQGHNCFPGVVYSRNIIVPFSEFNGRTACSADGKVLPATCSPYCSPTGVGFGYVSDTDFHITPTSPAVNFGSAMYMPPKDFDGQLRIAPTDAGSDQN